MVIEAKFKTVSTKLLADRVEFFQSDTMPIKHATIEKNLTDRGLSFVRGTLSMSTSEQYTDEDVDYMRQYGLTVTKI